MLGRKSAAPIKEVRPAAGLTADEVRVAKACGMTAKEYAKVKARLNKIIESS